jgi:hypothetical protein
MGVLIYLSIKMDGVAKNPLSRSGANELAEIVKFRKIDTLASMERTQPLDSMKMLTETLPEVSQRMMTWNYERRQHVNNSHQFILFLYFLHCVCLCYDN